jgi:hypothetical protein
LLLLLLIAGICVYVNCCRLFLNELPISPEISIYFRFGWEMGTPRSKKQQRSCRIFRSTLA